MKTNPQHQLFIREMIKHGNKTRAYKAAYPGTTHESARTASTRLMKEAHIKEELKNAHLKISVGIKEDREAFIHQELKVINLKRAFLLAIIAGNKPASQKEVLKAIKMDSELAEQQAQLLGYGSIRSVNREQCTENREQAMEKNAETVTLRNMKEEEDVQPSPLQPNENQAFPPLYQYGNEFYPVTNSNNFSCAPQQEKTAYSAVFSDTSIT